MQTNPITKSVAIVDKHKLMRDILSLEINKNCNDLEVVLDAQSIKEIYHVVKDAQIDAIIIDSIEIDLIPNIKNIAPKTKVIALSANKSEEEKFKAFCFGADKYFEKEVKNVSKNTLPNE